MMVVRRIALLFLMAPAAHAWDVLDYIRNYDLNDYALGVSYSVSQSPYFGADNSAFAYPYLTSFRHNAFTDDWLILTGGEAGFRYVSQSDWTLGAVGRINTQGTGANAIEDLVGLDTRNWAVELSPVVGWRRWPVHLELRRYVGVFSDNGGPSTELWASLPREFGWGWVVPSIKFIRNSAEHNSYYYGISADEIPGLDPYDPGASSNVKLDLNVGWAITDNWLLSGTVAYEWLGSEIVDSPIVARDKLWSGNIGIAYNNDIFRRRGYEGGSFRLPGFEFRAGLYKNNTDSKIIRLPTGGGPAEEIELEDVLGVNKKDDVSGVTRQQPCWKISRSLTRSSPRARRSTSTAVLRRGGSRTAFR
jgi:outer membrane scaffolding protein for murein synthesis (MipA/OmpV family)